MRQKRLDHNELYDIFESPFGAIYLICRPPVLTGISFRKPKGIPFKQSESSDKVKKELAEYFTRGRKDFTCRTAFVSGTDFEKRVWEELKKVKYGETQTYKWLSAEIGKPQAFRAVGNALAKNPLPIIFPCHRIIESDGSIGGYSSGIDIKRRLLELEYYTHLSRT
jgi:methylated-DNA-[protein]-cysteine S-methyltransferase